METSKPNNSVTINSMIGVSFVLSQVRNNDLYTKFLFPYLNWGHKDKPLKDGANAIIPQIKMCSGIAGSAEYSLHISGMFTSNTVSLQTLRFKEI